LGGKAGRKPKRLEREEAVSQSSALKEDAGRLFGVHGLKIGKTERESKKKE